MRHFACCSRTLGEAAASAFLPTAARQLRGIKKEGSGSCYAATKLGNANAERPLISPLGVARLIQPALNSELAADRLATGRLLHLLLLLLPWRQMASQIRQTSCATRAYEIIWN